MNFYQVLNQRDESLTTRPLGLAGLGEEHETGDKDKPYRVCSRTAG